MSDIDNMPILVGAGQCVEREAGSTSHLGMAAKAAAMAIADCGGKNVARSIDTICVIRLFSDSWHIWQSELGRSNNPPESIAAAIGAKPDHRIYSQAGGNEPQSRLIEFFADIAAGERELVLLSGAEALRNQRSAAKQGLQLDWNEDCTEPLENRGIGDIFPNPQEFANGINTPMYFYALIEQSRRARLGLSQSDYLSESAQLMASFSDIASRNPYAQWPGAMSASQILDAEPLTHLYTKRMVAQDSVNQGAALLLTSVSKARELGIPEDRWVFMHGAAQGTDVDVSLRPDPSTSRVATRVLDKALDMAECSVTDLDLFDIYSCFPCAVTAITDHLKLPTDGSVPLTLTGGLPYFGGPGNNYSMHGLAEATWQLRKHPGQRALVHANGGALTKHATGIFSTIPSTLDWAGVDTRIIPDAGEQRELIDEPESGIVVSYTVNYYQGEPTQVIALAETEDGRRFVCCNSTSDTETPRKVLTADLSGQRIVVTPGDQKNVLHFSLDIRSKQ